MKRAGCALWSALLLVALAGRAAAVLSDSDPRAVGMAQAYTALARGPESVFWNPANLALSDGRPFSWHVLGGGVSAVVQNNSFSVKTYNDHFTRANSSTSPRGSRYYISSQDKEELLADVPEEGLRLDTQVEPMLALGLPVNGGVAFPLPGGLRSAVALGLTTGVQGQVPRDIVELFLFGNQFADERVAAGRPAGYDIADWDGSAWALASFNWAVARAWMPRVLVPYLGEFTVGATLKVMGGAYGEILESGGEGLVSRISGVTVDAWAVSRSAGGVGAGLDLGVAGRTRDGKTTLSLGLLNLVDHLSWSIAARQDSLFLDAHDLRVVDVMDPDVENVEDVLDNEDVDGDGDVDFRKKIGEEAFSRSLPAVLRLGVARVVQPRLTMAAGYDQAFTSGFGLSTTPRLSTGLEYRLVRWFPLRLGISAGGGRGTSSAVGFALGPFRLGRAELRILDTAMVSRGGLLPGVAKGTAISAHLVRLDLH
ncbi:MAG: DUF5723 family protein [Candidatus Latescibacterota bacterium]